MSVKNSIIPDATILNIGNLLTSLAPLDVSETSIEVEARFGNFREKGFVSGVSRRTFNRIKELMSILSQFVYIHSKDEIFREIEGGTERFTTIYNNEGLPIDSFRLVKSKAKPFDFPDYFFRIGVSLETIDQTPKPVSVPIIIREKKRWSYTLLDKNSRVANSRLDLTEVTSSRPGVPRSAETVFEIEIEILTPKVDNLRYLEDNIISFLKEIQDTRIIYTSKEKSDIISRTNRYIGADPNRFTSIDFDAIIQLRNLKIKDLSVGEIIPRTNRDIRYTITIKADGKRKLLVIDELGIYLIYYDEVMKIAGAQTSARLKSWYGTVFECEYIPKSNILPTADPKYKAANIYAAIYDTLSVTGNPAIKDLDHLQRVEYIQKFTNVMQNVNVFIFEPKDFKSFSTVDEFFRVVNSILDTPYTFKTDGLIYTPDNYRYDSTVNKLNIKQRILSRQPDVLKWKPPSQLTIDFSIRHVSTADGNYIELLSGQNNQLVPFNGKGFNPRKNVLITNELQNAPNETVIEFRWSTEILDGDENDNENGKFVFVRFRNDKPYPNRLDVALDVWMDIHSPIDEDTIRGQKFNLSFRYHNREKWNLFNMVGKALPQQKFRTLLDIGSGRGGDVIKWEAAGFTHIICVEPNDVNRIELANRLGVLNQERSRNGKSDIKYRIVPTTGQDFQNILEHVKEFAPGGFVHAISYMLSLSFFFDKPESTISILYLVHNALMSGGYFLALTIDGRYVLEYFGNSANYIEENGMYRSHMKLIDFQLRPGPQVFINIPNSIVTNQIEYLTNIHELQKLLQTQPSPPLIMDKEWRTDKETFLLPEEIQYTRLFTAFVMKRT